MDRATFLSGVTTLAAAHVLPKDAFAALEAHYGGRLGVAAIDSANGAHFGRRVTERFPMCSTFKLLVAAAVLSRVDAGREHLGRHIAYGKSDLLEYAPITRDNVHAGFLSVQALCAAAVEYSDNTAANLLLSALGGPASVTAYARSLGDTYTRLDRNEPSLNSAAPGDPRDTTTPAAMASDLQKLLTGNALSPQSRHILASWLTASKTGAGRIRAGMPNGWRVGDKTGTGSNASSNDVAVIYPPGRPPIFVAAYYTGSSATGDKRDAVLAEVGRIVSSAYASRQKR